MKRANEGKKERKKETNKQTNKTNKSVDWKYTKVFVLKQVTSEPAKDFYLMSYYLSSLGAKRKTYTLSQCLISLSQNTL